jgi:large subunit ribosomal protein L30
MAQLKITQVKSKIRCLERHKRTLAALGLRHPHDTVIHTDTPQIRGMIATVDYLVAVESHDGTDRAHEGATKAGTAKLSAALSGARTAATTAKAARAKTDKADKASADKADRASAGKGGA